MLRQVFRVGGKAALADHAVSVAHAIEFRDGAVALRFMLEHEQDSLGLDFADPSCREVHAGHLLIARIFPKQVQLNRIWISYQDGKIVEKPIVIAKETSAPKGNLP